MGLVVMAGRPPPRPVRRGRHGGGARRLAWNVIHPAAARVSPGLVAKARAGTARIFSLDGTVWKDTTRDTAEGIRASLEAPRDPPPPVAFFADGHRLCVRRAPGTIDPGRSLRLYYGPVSDPDIYRGLLPIAGQETTLAVPPGNYSVTATLVAPDGRESAATPPVRLTIPARRQPPVDPGARQGAAPSGPECHRNTSRLP
jgi:hypothetical protein